jgi:hypothetical protein
MEQRRAVPEGLNEGSLARSAWNSIQDPVP